MIFSFHIQLVLSFLRFTLSLKTKQNMKLIKTENSERKIALDKCTQLLKTHFNHSKSSKCQSLSCFKISHVNSHMEKCQNKNASCKICRQFLALIMHHSKMCNNLKCLVPHCRVFKHIRHQKKLMVKFLIIFYF